MTAAQDQQSRAELLPCPFCGSPNVTLEHVGSTAYEAFCEFCGASGPCDSEQWRAAKGWNARALPAGMEPVAEIVECRVMGQQTVAEVDGAWKLLRIGDKLYTAAQVQAMGRVPPGWQAVPVELTREMSDAYLKADGRFHSARSDWAAMLAAAPRPPAAPATCGAASAMSQAQPVMYGARAVTTGAGSATTGAAQERKPLTDEEIREWWASENGLEDCDLGKLVDFIAVVREVEARLGVKPSP